MINYPRLVTSNGEKRFTIAYGVIDFRSWSLGHIFVFERGGYGEGEHQNRECVLE